LNSNHSTTPKKKKKKTDFTRHGGGGTSIPAPENEVGGSEVQGPTTGFYFCLVLDFFFVLLFLFW
jgi:hypothetical protein